MDGDTSRHKYRDNSVTEAPRQWLVIPAVMGGYAQLRPCRMQELVISVKTFKTKLAEKRRQEYTGGIARKIGIGLVRVKV